MKKIALIYGIISGFVMSLSFMLTIPANGKIDFEKGEIIGIAVMIISFSMVLVAIISYRKTFVNVDFSFGNGFRVGLLVTLISCAIYVTSWMIYYEMKGDQFTKQYTEYYINKINNSDSPEQEKLTQQQPGKK